MLALLSSPVRRWLLVTLVLPLLAFALGKIGLYLQRRNGGAPTRLSRALLSVSGLARRRSNRGHHDNDLIDNPRSDTASIASPLPATTSTMPQQ
ncbi:MULTISPECIES: hypothetical protein [Mycolicibacterium]|jgi:hypothetical protein|uniref:Uncharacterized protein n=2 Tax=Mycolicibacterium TaxID=1866885 RepID=A0A0M2K063_9MYCO|nr:MULTISPECIES: hypothetical protein [Mycolicibacterium]KKF00516.1 hypothetical protein WN67_18390 [Mycolicibacterium obuense]MCZ0732404.1 hypothetical protein [Mycolicibacterium iranicum]OKH71363.1 hypothetical protein EB72_23520 [Mycobacterium sp. SWH-M1]